MAQRWDSDLVGTLAGFFRINAVRLKDSSGRLDVRNAGDSAFSSVRAADVQVVDGAGNILTIDAATLGVDTSVLLPPKGTDGHFLRQKAGTAAGVLELELAAIAGSADKMTVDTTSLAFGTASPLSLFTLPASAVIHEVRVTIDTPFNGTPSLSIGTSGTTSKYMASTQVDLTAVAESVFRVCPSKTPVGGTEALIATYAAGGASAGAARIEVMYAIPA